MKNPLIYVGSTATAFLSSFIMAVLIQATEHLISFTVLGILHGVWS